MTEVNMILVKELRDRTQAKLNDCRSALIEAEGDIDKAIDLIRKKGQADSIKRAGALATEGVVSAVVSNEVGVILEVNVQTDFAARNQEYLGFVDNLLKIIVSTENLSDISVLPWFESGLSVDQARTKLVSLLGENVSIRRFARLKAPNGTMVAYNHPGSKIGVLIVSQVKCDTQLLSDLAMQVAAMNPLYTTPSSVPIDDFNAQKQFFLDQINEDGKKFPEDRLQMILQGKLSKWAKEICLLDQVSVFDSKKTVSKILDEAGVLEEFSNGKLSFIRYERGEGLVADKGDFASEVAAMAR